MKMLPIPPKTLRYALAVLAVVMAVACYYGIEQAGLSLSARMNGAVFSTESFYDGFLTGMLTLAAVAGAMRLVFCWMDRVADRIPPEADTGGQ